MFGLFNTLAFDFGASSGRAMLGQYDGNRLILSEMHRFENNPVVVNRSMYWDILNLFYEIKNGISITKNSGYSEISSIGIDTWGVDFGLLDKDGDLIGNPYHYRDSRTNGYVDKIKRLIGEEELYAQTGLESIFFNTLYQLASMADHKPEILNRAESLLMVPDLFNYFLSGEKYSEYTITSTTQLYNPTKKQWAFELMEKCGIPSNLFHPVVNPGTIIGTLRPELSEELSVGKISISTVASHDTESAIAAVPAEDGKKFAYISCGTWSLMGLELSKPLINQKTMEYNLANEGGVNDTTCLLKNIMGLWLVQECRRQWKRDGEAISYQEMEEACNQAKPFQRFVNPDDDLFVAPINMVKAIHSFCANSGQTPPESKGEYVRCIMESLAFKYRYTVEMLETVSGEKLDVIHIIGGGVKDKTLCQMTANATGRTVIAGPAEATAAGNLMVQLMAVKELKNLSEGRAMIKNSFDFDIYEPKDTQSYDAAYDIFRKTALKV